MTNHHDASVTVRVHGAGDRAWLKPPWHAHLEREVPDGDDPITALLAAAMEQREAELRRMEGEVRDPA